MRTIGSSRSNWILLELLMITGCQKIQGRNLKEIAIRKTKSAAGSERSIR